MESLQWAANQSEVPGQDTALGVNQPAGGTVEARLEQMLGGIQAGAEKLKTTKEDGDDISSGREISPLVEGQTIRSQEG